MMYGLSAIQHDEYVRLRLNERLAERGLEHRSTVESWSSFRHVAESMQRARAILREQLAPEAGAK